MSLHDRAHAAAPSKVFRTAVVSVVKHDYIANGILSHARFVPVVVTDDADQPEWVHARNQQYADTLPKMLVRRLDPESRVSQSLIGSSG